MRAKEEIKEKIHREVGRKLRCEMRLMWLLPLLSLVAAPWTTCAGGSPTWVYLLYVPVLLRAKYIEYQLLQQLEALSVKMAKHGSGELSFNFSRRRGCVCVCSRR